MLMSTVTMAQPKLLQIQCHEKASAPLLISFFFYFFFLFCFFAYLLRLHVSDYQTTFNIGQM